MFVANLALIALLGIGQSPSPDPPALVSQLGSARYAEREAAASALERIGREALPALRAAHRVKDLEIRTRASALVEKIEGALLTQPTLVNLDFQDRPLSEVVKAVRDQSGIKLALVPENSPSWGTTRVTLRESAPVPFWKALDKLCDAGQLQYNFGMQGFPNSREPVFPLFAGTARPSGPIWDQGPFRVNVVSLHYQRDVAFLPGGGAMVMIQGEVNGGHGGRRILPAMPPGTARPNHSISEQFYIQVQVAAEPRLSLSQNGPLKVIEAVDDRGQSLKIASNGNGNAMTQRFSGYFGLATGSVIQMQAQLVRPSVAGRSIRKFRGEVPLAVSTRKPSPLVIPLNGASGKTFQNDEVALSIQEMKVNPNTHQTSIELSLRPTANSGAGFEPRGVGQAGEVVVPHRPDIQQQQIEIVDSQGRIIPWYHASFDAEGVRMTLTMTPHDQAIAPAELRYYGLARANTDVAFEFTEIPMP